MPRRDYGERHRKKTRYSSDSSDLEKRSRSRREKSRSKKKSSYRSSRKQRETSSSNSSSSRSRSSSTSSQSSDSRSKSRTNHSSRSSSVHQKKSKSVQKEPEQVKNFDLDNLYKEKDKIKALEDIESDSFKQAAFKQSSSSKIIVDLEMDKIMLPATSAATQEDESLIHPSFLGDSDKRVDKWIKKLYTYRNQ
ncbi:hypothetical protein ACKWTF_005852 [Chironomus riparius]